MKLPVKQILNTSRQDIWNTKGKVTVIYDDGTEVVDRHQEIIFNRYCWELFLLYPNTPITPECGVKSVVGDDFFNADTHIKLLEKIYKYIIKYNNVTGYSNKYPLLQKVYEIVDIIQNEILYKISDYVSTIDATDFINLVNMPEIIEAESNLKDSPESVERVYKAIKHYMVHTTVKGNKFIDAYRNKAINENQANQCIGPRGVVSGLDRSVFKLPIKSGFIKGMSNLYEMMAESCTAAKALNASDTHIQQSEYGSRRIQLLTMTVRNVVNGDCGSTEYMDMMVTPGNIDNLKGKYYLNEEENKLACLEGDETYLYNKIIKFRTALKCHHQVASDICSTCLGKLSQNFKENSNLGYTMTAYLMEKISQSILSTKHLTHSVKKSMITLEGLSSKYFYPNEEGDIYFHNDINLKGMQIILPNSKLHKLVDVLNLAHTNIGLSKIGELTEIILRDTKEKTPVNQKLLVSYKDRNSIITRTFLDYLRATDMDTDARGNFVVPLDKYDKSNPIFNIPLKETNIINFLNKVTNIIETNTIKITDPIEKLNYLFDTVTEKFKCNISVLEVLMYATTTYNYKNDNYRLGRMSMLPYTQPKINIFRHRDFAALGANEHQMSDFLNKPSVIFSNNYRESHPMSVFFVPQALVK